MGLFDSDKETYVSSSVYNLAGEEGSRPQPLKAAIIRRAVVDTGQSTADILREALMQGSGRNQRRFFKWATDNYHYGMPTGQIETDNKLTNGDIKAALVGSIAEATEANLEIITGQIDKADARYWAEAYISKNMPTKLNTPWGISVDLVDVDRYDIPGGYAINEVKLVINFDDSTEVRLNVPANLVWGKEDQNRRLLYVTYNLITVDPETLLGSVDGPYLYTYRMGSGVADLDALAPEFTEMNEFYPAIPLRLNNKKISEYPDKASDNYTGAKKAYSKLTGSDIDEMLAQLDDNPDISKIDYALLVQGVPLNTSEQMGRRYLFEFFKTLQAGTVTAPADYNQMNAEIVDGIINTNLRNIWKFTNVPTKTIIAGGEGATKTIVDPDFTSNNTLFGVPRPDSSFKFQYRNQKNNLIVKMADLDAFHYFMEWESISESDHVGNMKRFDGNQTREKATVGEYWVVQGTPARARRLMTQAIAGSEGDVQEGWRTVNVPRTFLFYQYAKRRYTKLEVRELRHRNYVYGAYAVKTSAEEALAAETDSRFILPLHFPTVKKIGLSNANKLANSSSYLVLNTVETVTIQWYQKGFFKVVLIFAAVATAAFTGGFSIVGGSGILGANVAVGAAIGASAATAALIGAAVNYIAATIVAAIIQYSAQEVIGGAAGAIIGTIASFVAIQYGAQYAASGNFNVDWGSLMQVDNIIKLTDSVSSAYTQWMQGETEGIVQEISETTEQFNEQTDKIREMTEDILGMTNVDFDPMMFTDAAEYFGESSEAFLNRTLLTGSDIANIVHAMIEHFVPSSLELPKAISK